MDHEQRHHPLPPLMKAADNTVVPIPALDNESWADTLVVAGLIVVLGVLVFLLTG